MSTSHFFLYDFDTQLFQIDIFLFKYVFNQKSPKRSPAPKSSAGGSSTLTGSAGFSGFFYGCFLPSFSFLSSPFLASVAGAAAGAAPPPTETDPTFPSPFLIKSSIFFPFNFSITDLTSLSLTFCPVAPRILVRSASAELEITYWVPFFLKDWLTSKLQGIACCG